MILSFSVFNNINFTNDIYLILLKTLLCHWISMKYKKLKIFKNLSWIGIIAANFFLFLFLGLRWLISNYFPLSNLYESFLFLDWCLLFLLLVIEYKNETKIIGAVILPITWLLISFANLILPQQMQSNGNLVPALQSNWLMMHVSMMILSYSALLVGSLLSILFLIILNTNHFYLFFSEKNINTNQLLENIDSWSYRTISLGFPLLTIGILAGAIWANDAWGNYWSWDPKETWALITWLIFAAYIHARLTQGWIGKKAAILGTVGFFIIWICYLGVNFLGQGLHSYGFLS